MTALSLSSERSSLKNSNSDNNVLVSIPNVSNNSKEEGNEGDKINITTNETTMIPSNENDKGCDVNVSASDSSVLATTTTTTTEKIAVKVVQNIPRGFVPTPFPFHFQVNIVIDALDYRLGWGKGHIAEMIDQEEADTDILEKVPSGWEIRVPLVLPGDLVRVSIFKNFDTELYSEADLIKVVRPSPDRIEPRCPLFGRCGGCQFQHMEIDYQRKWKTEFVRLGLESQNIRGYTTAATTATATTTEVGSNTTTTSDTATSTTNFTTIRDKLFPTTGTDEIFEYRNKLTPHYEAPIKMGDDAYELQGIGFQQVACKDILDVEDCPIATPAINVKFKEVRATLHEQAEAGLLNNKKRRRRNRRSKNEDVGATILFREADNDPETGKPVIVTDFREYMTTTIKGIKFRYMAGNFFQNNNYVVPLMVDAVLGAALVPVKSITGDDNNTKVPSYFIDCYCGSGLFALTASTKFKLCVGIEVNEKAIEEATENATANSITNCQFVAASAEAIFISPPALTIAGFENQKIQDFPREETVVVLDPPRKGCSGKFLEQLYEYGPQRIVYMSCGPATQARDAKGIVEVGGYDIICIQPFDLFPQTKHVECLMVFEKRR